MGSFACPQVKKYLSPLETLGTGRKLIEQNSISSSGHLRPALNHKILNVALLRLRFRSLRLPVQSSRPGKLRLRMGAIQKSCNLKGLAVKPFV